MTAVDLAFGTGGSVSAIKASVSGSSALVKSLNPCNCLPLRVEVQSLSCVCGLGLASEVHVLRC